MFPSTPLPLTLALLRTRSMGQEEWASLQHALHLLVAQFLRDELSVFVLLNFVTSIYALGAFVTKVRSKSRGPLILTLFLTLTIFKSNSTQKLHRVKLHCVIMRYAAGGSPCCSWLGCGQLLHR